MVSWTLRQDHPGAAAVVHGSWQSGECEKSSHNHLGGSEYGAELKECARCRPGFHRGQEMKKALLLILVAPAGTELGFHLTEIISVPWSKPSVD